MWRRFCVFIEYCLFIQVFPQIFIFLKTVKQCHMDEIIALLAFLVILGLFLLLFVLSVYQNMNYRHRKIIVCLSQFPLLRWLAYRDDNLSETKSFYTVSGYLFTSADRFRFKINSVFLVFLCVLAKRGGYIKFFTNHRFSRMLK